MLQLDESQLEVYSCSFSLTIYKAYVPLKTKDSSYYLEWKIKKSGNGVKTKMQKMQKNQIIKFKETLKVHTELLKSIQTGHFLKKYSQLTIFVISSRNPNRPKIVGSMLIGLHEIYNNKKFTTRQKHRLKYSPLDMDLEIECHSTECQITSILSANLDAALVVQQNLLFMRGGSLSGIRNNHDLEYVKKKITREYLTQDDQISRGGCSFIRSDMDESMELKDEQRQPRKSLLLESAIKVNQPYYQDLNQISYPENSILADLSRAQKQLFIENKNLRKLLWVAKNQKRIEVERLQEEIRDLVHQVTIKQDELLRIKEQKQCGAIKVGQLLDGVDCSSKNCLLLKKQNESLSQSLRLQKQINVQLNKNYEKMYDRLQIIKDWEEERNFLMAKINDLEEDNQMIKIKYYDLENKICLKQEHFKSIVKQYKLKIQELETEITQRQSRIDLITSKVAMFEQQLQKIQSSEEETELVHRLEYSSEDFYQTKQFLSQKQYVTRKNYSSKFKQESLINIAQQSSQLKNIKEEDLQESIPSIDQDHKYSGQKQITTASDLADNGDSQFYRKILFKTQRQLDQLKKLYQQKDSTIAKERRTNRSLFEELQRLRFEFLYELSKVTKSLNQKLFEIKHLREQNLRLQSNDFSVYQQKIIKLEDNIDRLQEQKLNYFDRCFRLEEENLALIHINRQKQDIYQSIMKDPYGQKENKDMISKQFERLIQIMFSNKITYIDILTKYGFIEEEYLKHIVYQPQLSSYIYKKQKSCISNIIYQFNTVDENNHKDSACFAPFLQSSQNLLLQSKASNIKNSQSLNQQTDFKTQYFKRIYEQLFKLNQNREKGLPFIKEIAAKAQVRCMANVGPQIQTLKTYVIKYCGKDHQLGLLRLLRDLQSILESTQAF